MPENRLRIALIIILSLLLAMVSALALGCGSSSSDLFSNGKGDSDSDGGKDEGDVEDEITDVVDRFFRAFSNGDEEKMADTFSPDDIEEFEDEFEDAFEDALLAYFFAGGTWDVSGLKYKIDVDDDEATVTVVKGEYTYVDESGQEVTETLTRKDDIVFEMVKLGKKWYISLSTFPDLASGDYADTTAASNTTPAPVPTPNPTPAPQPPSPEYATCGTCGGAGWITCSVCAGEGGYYAEYEETCPDCGGSGTFVCWYCGGAGDVEGGDGRYTCDVCYGTGYTYCETCGELGYIISEYWEDCGNCGGSGGVGCPNCGGSGYVRI